MSASSYRPLTLSIAGSSETQYLVPNSLTLNKSMNNRATLSFEIKKATSDWPMEIGHPVYLSAGSSTVYTEFTCAKNQKFEGELYSTDTGRGWIQGKSTCFWEKRIDGIGGAAYLTTGTLKFVNAATSSNQILEASQARYGNWSSNAIRIEPYIQYRVSVDSSINLTALNGGYTRMIIYTGAASTMNAVVNMTDTTTLTGSVTFTTNFTNTTHMYMDVRLGLIYGKGTVAFSNLVFEKVTLPHIFGGTVDSFSQRAYPFSSYMRINVNAVDFGQSLNRRVAYKTYNSSGLGKYTLVNTSETFTGDGITKGWALTYPAASSADPTITLNGLACDTTSISGSSTHGYYYTPSSNYILGNSTNSAPASTDSLKVVYKAQSPTTMYDSDIISDLAADFLTGEGIDAITCVPQDAAVSEFSVNFSPMDRAYDRICALAGNSWYVDPWKRVNYIIELGSTAPFMVTSTTANWRDLVVNVSRGNYRNKEFLLGCYTQISTTESFKGDGYTRTWTLSKPVQGVPLVKVDGYISTVGISGVSASTFGYYWNKGSNQISGNTTNAALASTDWITIQYPALYPIYETVTRTTQVALREYWECNNSGLYEMAESVPNGVSTESAYAYAIAKLLPFGEMVKQVTFETDIDGLEVGMNITIEPSNYPYIGPFFITSISAKDVDIRTMRYKVTATNSAGLGNWFEFYRALLRDNTVRYTENFENLALHEGYY